MDAQQRLGVEAGQLVTALLLSLAWQFGADVEIACDQWFGVGASVGDRSEFVACDSPIDGLVYCWSRLSAGAGFVAGPHVDNAATRETSARQLVEQMQARAAWKTHSAECGQCETECAWKLCAAGEALWEHHIKAHAAVDAKWGCPSDDAKVFWDVR